MSLFDQRGQHVNTQYNAQYMRFGAIQSKAELIAELEKLTEEVARARQDGTLDKKQATEAENQLTKAVQEAEESKPNKKTLLDHLATAKALLEDISAASGVVSALVSAIEVVRKLF
jgi:hypothetical protein